MAREALEQASIRVGEINTRIPRTFGDTFVQAAEFDFLIGATDPPIYFDRWEIDSTWDQVAKHVASLIEDGSCLAFSIGPLYEALAKRLTDKHHLGIHSPIFTDPLMDLMIGGTVTNRRKENFRGKALTSYAFGTKELMAWLDNNPLVEFQRISRVFNPVIIGSNPRFVTVVAARKVDLCGRVGLYSGKGNVAAGPAEVMDFLNGAELSDGGRSIFALTSRDPTAGPNILLSIADLPNQFNAIESVGAVVTEYGIAATRGRTDRDVIDALIGVADSAFQESLVDEATRAGKLEAGYQICPDARNNTSRVLDEIFARDDLRAYFPPYPLGTELTATEPELVEALEWMKSVADRPWSNLGTLLTAVARGGTTDQQAALSRMGLARPSGMKERGLRRLLHYALERK